MRALRRIPQGDFQVAEIPWASQTLAVGEVLELMVDLVQILLGFPVPLSMVESCSQPMSVTAKRMLTCAPESVSQIDVTWFLFRLRLILAGSRQTKRDLVAHVHHHRFRRLTAGSGSHAFSQLHLKTSGISRVPM